MVMLYVGARFSVQPSVSRPESHITSYASGLIVDLMNENEFHKAFESVQSTNLNPLAPPISITSRQFYY